jgi:hypothetical protein
VAGAVAPELRESARANAAEAVRLVQVAPRRARELAEAARAEAGDAHDLAAASTAERALGLAAKELKDIPAAVRHLRQAVRLAVRGGDPTRAAEARMSLALALAYAGRTTEAVRTVTAAAPALRGADAARLQMQRALILQRLGKLDEALDGYSRALRSLRRSGDKLWEARLLNNRGLLRAYQGDARAAVADLTRAGALYRDLGQDFAVAETEHNLGFVAGRAGDVPSALEHFDCADEYFRAHRLPRAIYLVDRCHVLLSVRLDAEARRAAEDAVAELERAGMESDLAEAQLMLAEAALAVGDSRSAAAAAGTAARSFRRQDRHAWAALADYAALRARRQAAAPPRRLLSSCYATADALASHGWHAASLDARILTGRIALDLDLVDEARAAFARAAGARKRGHGLVRARAWHAEALVRLAEGRRTGAYGALRAGLRTLDRHRATLGATELRAHASEDASELARLGLRLALEDGDGLRALTWSEAWRASALRAPPVRPPDDAALARDLAELRQVVAELDDALRTGADARRLQRAQLALETSVRARSRRARGRGAPSRPATRELAQALGAHALVEYVRLDGELHAITLVDGRARLHGLGSTSAVERELDALRFSVRRLAYDRGPARARAVASAAAEHAAAELDAHLLQPLASELADRPIVVVPTGPLHAVPWSALPSNRAREVAVSPSATLWFRARRTAGRRRRGPPVLVAGPGLPGAEAEVRALKRLYPESSCLSRGQATVEQTLRAIDGADLAHLAAHGSFRADNPLFSCIRLADGPMTVYDVEGLKRPPRILVLSACDVALSGVRPGDELMGLAAALLGMGTACVIASVTTIQDEVALELMVAFHRRLLGDESPAAALARASEDCSAIASKGFVCLGAG